MLAPASHAVGFKAMASAYADWRAVLATSAEVDRWLGQRRPTPSHYQVRCPPKR